MPRSVRLRQHRIEGPSNIGFSFLIGFPAFILLGVFTVALPYLLIGNVNPDYDAYREIYHNQGAWLQDRFSLFIYVSNAHKDYFSDYDAFRLLIISLLTPTTIFLYGYSLKAQSLHLISGSIVLVAALALRNTVLLREALAFSCAVLSVFSYYKVKPKSAGKLISLLFVMISASWHISGIIFAFVVLLSLIIPLRLRAVHVLALLIVLACVTTIFLGEIIIMAKAYERIENDVGLSLPRILFWIFNVCLALTLYKSLVVAAPSSATRFVSTSFLCVVIPSLFLVLLFRLYEVPNVMIVNLMRSFDFFVHLGVVALLFFNGLNSSYGRWTVTLVMLRFLTELRWL